MACSYMARNELSVDCLVFFTDGLGGLGARRFSPSLRVFLSELTRLRTLSLAGCIGGLEWFC